MWTSALRNFILITVLLGTQFANAVEIPRNLNQSDREAVLQILGLGTSNKILTNPYPLGGYPGVELGVSYEFIALEDLSRLGSRTESQDDLIYPRFSVGKGLYQDVDMFFHFTPFNEKSGVSDYGGFLKWSFYQAKFFPINVSLLLDGNISNIRDELVSQTIGFNIVNGVTVNNFALYFGGGWVRSRGRFIGSSTSGKGITDTGREEIEVLHQFHTLIGLTLSVEDVFLAIQVDRYRDPVYSAKLGLRL